MIKLSFVRGSALRKVFINKRLISMLAQETGFQPISIDLDKIDEKVIRAKLGKEGLELIKEITKLKTEEEMEQDIRKDFRQEGWRLFKRE